MTTQWYDYIGYIAAVCIAIFAIPQLINLIKTKNTSYISLLMYSIYLVGCYAFTLAGIFMVAGVDRARTIDGLPLILADGVASIIATIILV
jgi:MtN3 and saliva related transmembrane protein